MPKTDASREFGPSTMPTISEPDRDLLHAGMWVGGCQIVEPIGQDDSSILYVATDSLLQRHVMVREHFPQGLVTRNDAGEVVPVTGADLPARHAAYAAFLRGARWLTRFDHPFIGRALRVWEERGTAYLMMPMYEGQSLAASQRHGGPVDEAKLRALLSALCDALAPMHAAGVFHLGLSPESIWVQPDGRPVLFDLSCAAPAAQRTVSDNVDRQFAPIELFAHGSALPVGPWTDIYSLGAVMHHALLGRPPLSAAVLGLDDVHAPLAEGLSRRGPGRMSAALPSAVFVAAIDRALAVRPENRPQDLMTFRRLLGLDTAQTVHPPVQPPVAPRPEPPVLTSMPPQPAPVPRPAPESAPDAGALPNNSPETGVDAAAAAAIAMAVSSLPWANEREPAMSAEPPGFSPMPGRNAPREPGLGPQTFVMPGPAKRTPPAPSKRPGRLAAAMFGLLACAGMAGWYTKEHPQQVAGWFGLSIQEPAQARSQPARAAEAPAPAAVPNPASVETVLSEAPPAAAPASVPASPMPTPAPAAVEPTPPSPAPAATPEPPRGQAKVQAHGPKKAATPPASPAEPVPDGPKAVCGTRTNFALYRCMETQCSLPRFSRHPQCVVFRFEN